MNQTTEDFDFQVRKAVYDVAMQRGYPPTLAETSSLLHVTPQEVGRAFQRLAAGRVLVLQPENGEVLMASPFSAVPTPFLVQLDAYSCYGNCIWDALGVLAMLKKDGRIATSCPDCGTALEVRVANGSVQAKQGLIHFAIPALHWWDDVVFT